MVVIFTVNPGVGVQLKVNSPLSLRELGVGVGGTELLVALLLFTTAVLKGFDKGGDKAEVCGKVTLRGTRTAFYKSMNLLLPL